MLGPGLGNMYIAVGVVGWVFYARLVAAEVKVQRRLDYADAGRVMGYSHTRIIFRHLLPNAITPAIVYWMTDMALAILLGSSLGYLGLGAQPPAAEWGVLIADGKNFMTTAWWISVFPGIAIVITGLGFSLARRRPRRTAADRADERRRRTQRRRHSRCAASPPPSPRRAASFTAVDGIDLDVAPGEVLGLVGEFGIGQERDAALDRAAGPRAGQGQRSVEWQGRDLLALCRARTSRKVRGAEIAMIFQEPMTALNPVLPVRLQIEENLQAHTPARRASARRRARWS